MDAFTIGLAILGVAFLGLCAWYMYNSPDDEEED